MVHGKWLAVWVLGVLLSACGGGGGGTNVSGSSGSGSSGGGNPAVNVAAVTVDSGPTITAADGCSSATDALIGGCVVGQTANRINTPYVTVTICQPNTSNCQTIDHVMVDTGSSGLRIVSTVLNTSLLGALQAGTDTTGQPLTECLAFGSGYMWGTVRTADVRIATTGSGTQEVASGLNIQIAGDSAASPVPSGSSCAGLPAINDVYAAGANGLLGVGLFVNDCATGTTCAAGAGYLMYYNCPTSGAACSEVSVASNQQVANPVATLVASDGRADNTGAILELPAVSNTTGAPTASGTLVFGIDTRPNNSLTTTQNVIVSDGYGNMEAQLTSDGNYGGTGSQPYSMYSFFDSGSTGIYLPGTTIPCDNTNGGWFTPASTLSITATVQAPSDYYAANPAPVAVNLPFLIANATTLFATGDTAYGDLGAPASSCSGSPGTGSGTSGSGPNSGIDFGLPVFMGRNMYVGLETSSFAVGGTTYTYFGPLWAF
jgi:hypothetical protein